MIEQYTEARKVWLDGWQRDRRAYDLAAFALSSLDGLIDAKSGNGAFAVMQRDGKFHVAVDDGQGLPDIEGAVTFATADDAYGYCKRGHDNADGMEIHAYHNACTALMPYCTAAAFA